MKKIFSIAIFSLALFCFVGINNTQAVTIQELQVQINALMQQIAQLQQQLAQAQGQGSVSSEWCYTFISSLKHGDTGNEVYALQIALEKQGFDVGTDKGNTGATSYFRDKTASAVSAFQEKYASEILAPWGLTNGVGYVGPKTRIKLNQLYGCGTTTTTSSIIPSSSFFNFNVAQGAPNPAHHELHLTNASLSSVSFNLSVPNQPAWLNTGYNTQTMSLQAGGVMGVGVSIDATKASTGTHTTNLVVSGNFANSPITIPITLTVISPFITVISPNGGEELVMGNTYDITWDFSDMDIDFEIYIRDDRAGPAYKLIASELSSSVGKYSWTIPVDFWGPYSAGENYKIQVRRKGEVGISDESDNYFSLLTFSSGVTSCTNYGDSEKDYYEKGWTYRKFTFSDGSIGGGTYTESCSGENLTEYWCETDSLGIQSLHQETYSCPNGCESGACIASKEIRLGYPNGSESFRGGTNHLIEWYTIGVDSVNIKLLSHRTDNDSNTYEVNNIASNVSADSYLWTVPIEMPCNQYSCPDYSRYDCHKVEVVDSLYSRPSQVSVVVSDQSDNCFNIVNPEDSDYCDWTDINRDGKVDGTDQAYVVTNWNIAGGCSAPSWCNLADTNKDGFVNTVDQLNVRNNLGSTNCASAMGRIDMVENQLASVSNSIRGVMEKIRDLLGR